MRFRTTLALMGAAVAVTACDRNTSPTAESSLAVADAFTTTPAGFDQVTSSFVADSTGGSFQPHFDGRGPGGPGGPPRADGQPGDDRGPGAPGRPGQGPGFGLGLMGGGLGGPFLGDGLTPGFGRGPFGSGALNGKNCTFASGTGLITCDPRTRDGVTITLSGEYQDSTGKAQSAVDSTTNTITTTVSASGTITRRDSSTSAISESSTQTISGLIKGSSAHTVNGKSAGSETTNGTSDAGTFTAVRTVGDTIAGLVLPAPTTSGPPPYPTAGTVTRAMSVTVTVTGQTPTTSSRREVVTYDGSATAKVVITQDGTTQNCTQPLPHGKLACGS